MFAQGIQLTLLVGPIMPLPVPRVVLDALQSVEVRTTAGSASGFQLTFTITARSPLNTIFLLAAGTNTGMGTPPLRVLLIVTMNGSAQPLFDGVMTHVEVQPGGRGQAGTLTVTGIRSGTQVSSYLDIAATQGVWLVADVEWMPTTEAFPLNAHAARVVAADGRRYGGTSEIATGCTRTQAGVTFVCALAFEMAPTALAGAALHVAASSSVDDADDVAVIDLGLDAAGAAALASAAGRVVLAEPHVKEP